MQVYTSIIAKGRPNRPEKAMVPKYITIHETGNYAKGATAAAHASYLRNTSAKVSWHYTVDDKCAYQHIPNSEVAYHAGDTYGNSKSIGIEICVNSDGNFDAAVRNAAELVRKLMKVHNIPIENVVQHNRWNGKDCPKSLRKSGWREFISMCKEEEDMTKAEVIAIIEEYEKNKAKQGASDWAKEGFNAAKGAGVMDGTAPKGNVTREMLATVLHRLGFFK